MPSKLINILHLCNDYTLRDTDMTVAINNALCEYPFNVTATYLQGEPSFQMPPTSSHLNYHFFNFSPKSLKGYRYKVLKALLKFCHVKNFDIVITHRFKPCYLIAFASLFISFKKKIAFFHGCGEFDRVYRKFIAKTFMRNFHLVAVSQAVKEDLLKAGCGFKSEQITVIHNAIDVKKIEANQLPCILARNELGLPHPAFIFGQIARLVPAKGQHYLLQAFKQCQPLDAHLVIIGEGNNEACLRQEIARLNLEHQVHLLGNIPNAYRYLAAFDVFVLTSLKEGFGVVLLEAMAAKVPIIATNTQGIPEVVDGLATLCSIKDVQQLAIAMQNAYQQVFKIRQQQGMRLYEHLHQHFNIDNYNEAIRKLCLVD